jgi:ribosomal protein L37E
MDNLTICDRCGSDACYVTEVNHEVKNYSCFGCGFITNTLMTRDSEFLTEQMESLPDLYKELMGEDENGKVWMPNTVNIPGQGMVFADGTRANNWRWGAVLSSEEGDKMDMSTIKHFEERDYMEALDYIGVFKQA